MTKHRRKNQENKIQMVCRCLKENYYCFLLLAAILMVAGIIWVAAPLSHNAINNELNTVFERAWQYSINGEGFQTVELPDSRSIPSDSEITLKNQLPTEIIKGATLLIRTSQQDAKVLVDQEMIYSTFDSDNNMPAPTSAYHFVRLPTDCAGQEITVILSSPYDNYAGYMNQIYIGSKASNIFFLIHENGLRSVIGFLISSLGLLMMVMFVFTKGKENKFSFIYLGAFFFCAGYWVMVESKMLQFIIPYPVALTNSSIFALFLLPVFLGLYYYSTHTKTLKKVLKYIIIIVTSTSFIFSVVACIAPTMPLYILPYHVVFMGFYLIAIFAVIIVEGIKADKLFSTSVCGVILFGICCLLELASYLADITAYNNSTFLTIGLILLCIAMVVDAVGNFAKIYQNAIKVDTLSVLAYTDSLTDLKNRMAFLERFSNLETDGTNKISLGMFDINNLKIVNDTLGHLVGDALLRHSAKAIKRSLRKEDDLYRIGGDEFAAIIRHDNEVDLRCFESRLEDILIRENQKQLDYKISIAYGYATFLKEKDKTLFETLKRADEKMYTCKKKQKSIEGRKDESNDDGVEHL